MTFMTIIGRHNYQEYNSPKSVRHPWKRVKMYSELNRKVKTCNKCGIEKDFELFQNDIKGRFGKSSWCKTCKSERRQRPEVRAYDNAYNKMYAKKNAAHIKARTRRNNIRKLYGMTQEQYLEMAKGQNDRCAVCNVHVSETKYPSLCVDHCHNTLKIRGLLCDTCNRSLGLLKEDTNVLKNAIAYLERFRARG